MLSRLNCAVCHSYDVLSCLDCAVCHSYYVLCMFLAFKLCYHVSYRDHIVVYYMFFFVLSLCCHVVCGVQTAISCSL